MAALVKFKVGDVVRPHKRFLTKNQKPPYYKVIHTDDTHVKIKTTYPSSHISYKHETFELADELSELEKLLVD